MQLTNEQLEIIDISKRLQSNQILSIQACAGSGKTSTLKEIALNNPQKKFLYLAFNRAIVEEASSKFPSNVVVKTMHALALAYTREKLGNFEIGSNLNIFDLERIYDTSCSYEDKIATLRDFNIFLKSNISLEEASLDTKKVWNAILNREIPISHDFYLKFFSLANDNLLDKRFDCVLLDEAQDTNHTMLSIFLKNNCSKILVGDTYQNIYGFNNSINAFDIVNADYQLSLNVSFRCKQEILDYANFFLSVFADKNFKDMVSGYQDNRESNNKIQKAFITRTNSSIIEFINDFDEEDYQYFCLGKEPKSIFEPIFALMNFKKKNFYLLPKQYAYFKNFVSYSDLIEYMTSMNNKDILSADTLLRQGLDIKKLYAQAQVLFENKEAIYCITNAHQSKGLEWDKVELYKDFSSLIDMKKKLQNSSENDTKLKLEQSMQQELHLFYVAITRAKSHLKDTSDNLYFFNSIQKKEEKKQIKRQKHKHRI